MKIDILSLSPQAVIFVCVVNTNGLLFLFQFLLFFFFSFSFVLMKKRYTVQNIPALAL